MSISEENNKSKNEISRKVFLALSSNVMVTLFGLISLFFIKRYMGYEALGIFAFAMAYVSLFKIFGENTRDINGMENNKLLIFLKRNIFHMLKLIMVLIL